MNEVTNSLCEARMKIIDTKLDSIIEKQTDLIDKVESINQSCIKIPDHEKRIAGIEKWKDNFTFTKIIITVGGTVTALLVIYKFLIQLIFGG